jgi:glycosyltransferase involved in cell wall biosynthesis
MNPPLVSVITTTRNEEKVIKRLLESIKMQTYSNIEIIVVDNNSNDKTKTIASEYTKKVYNVGPERSAQRNYGVSKAKGKYILILDADMELTKKIVFMCLQKVNKINKFGGLVIKEESIAVNYWEKVKAFERSFYNLEGDSITDAARFFNKNIFIKAGGYDTNITGPEDWDLPERIKKHGYNIGRVNTVIYHHERINSLYQLAKKKYYYAHASHKYLSKHQIPVVSAKTIYFLRPVFYNNWKRLVSNPLLTIGMVLVLTVEQISGGLGYLKGRRL